MRTFGLAMRTCKGGQRVFRHDVPLIGDVELKRPRVPRATWSCAVGAAVGLLVAACGASQTARGPMRHAAALKPAPGATVVYRGLTSQHGRIGFVVDRGRSVVTALWFAMVYSCPRHHLLRLHALILRPDDAWGLVERWPTTVIGFSDWFSGPDGHDFHVTGTLSTDASVLSGTIHSLLRAAGRRTGCDSGHLRFHAALTAARPGLPVPVSLTLRQYKALPSGITIAAAQRILGPPNDREIFRPARVIANTATYGPAGSRQSWLDYRWKGHPPRYFQFFFHAGRLLSHGLGRSIADT